MQASLPASSHRNYTGHLTTVAELSRATDKPIVQMVRNNPRQLCDMPGIGEHLAFTIETLVRTGKVVSWPERHSQRYSSVA